MERALRAAKRGWHRQKGKVAQIWQSNPRHLGNVGELRHGLQEAAKARGEVMRKDTANYLIDRALAHGQLDSA